MSAAVNTHQFVLPPSRAFSLGLMIKCQTEFYRLEDNSLCFNGRILTTKSLFKGHLPISLVTCASRSQVCHWKRPYDGWLMFSGLWRQFHLINLYRCFSRREDLLQTKQGKLESCNDRGRWSSDLAVSRTLLPVKIPPHSVGFRSTVAVWKML